MPHKYNADRRHHIPKMSFKVQNWPAYEAGLRHRADVRRPMLRHMMADPALADQARALHRAAQDWYGTGQDPTLDKSGAATEAAYHDLMLRDGTKPLFPFRGPGLDGFGPGSGPLGRSITALGNAVDDMPPGVRAQVMVVRNDDLADDDLAALPADVFGRWLQDRGGALVTAGRLDRALALSDRRRTDVARPSWLDKALMDAGRLDDIGAEWLFEASVQTLAAVAAAGDNKLLWPFAAELLRALTGGRDGPPPQGADPWFAALLMGRGMAPSVAGSLLRPAWLKDAVKDNPALPAALNAAAGVAARSQLADTSLRAAVVGAYAGHARRNLSTTLRHVFGQFRLAGMAWCWGGLIQAAVGFWGGLGDCLTKRSGCSAKARSRVA